LPGTIALAFSVLLVGSLPGLALTSCGASTMPAWVAATSPNQPASDNVLNGVAADSASDVWAVGYSTPPAGTSGTTQTLIEHYDGSTWSLVGSQNVLGAGNVLTAVVALSPSNVWAVGDYADTTGLNQTLIEHYDGSTWSLVGSQNVAASNNYLTGVAAFSATNMWAVGYSSAVGRLPQPLIEHYDGHNWSLYGASTGPVNCILSGVAVVPATSALWAVGNCTTTNGLPQPLIEYYDGTSWSVSPGASTASAGSEASSLSGVAADSASDGWAVGYVTPASSGLRQTLIERYDGSSWSLLASPNAGAYQNELNGVAAVSANDVWAVGEYSTAAGAGGLNQTLIEHYDGSNWSIVFSPNSLIEDNHLTGVAVVPGTARLWAVGYYGHGQTTSPDQTAVMEH
jgi:hypothetical protein